MECGRCVVKFKRKVKFVILSEKKLANICVKDEFGKVDGSG
jgi:hypothetical protein